MRVAVDARRQRDNGVARVTRLLIDALAGSGLEIVALGPRSALSAQFPDVEAVEYGAPLLSADDLFGLDRVLQGLEVDCLVAPQFYVSPLTACPQVRILHDTIPLEPGAALPAIAAVAESLSEHHLDAVGAGLLGPGGGWGSAELYHAYYAHSVAAARRLLTVSKQSAADLVRHFPESREKLSILPLYPDASVSTGSKPEPSARPVDVLHVSKMEPRKNQIALLDAWASIARGKPGLRACFVGAPSTFYPEYSRDLMARIESGVAAGWLTYETGIDDARLAQRYSESKIVCIPSMREGFGLPALEGMVNGCAVVATQGTAVGEVCGNVAVYTGPTSTAMASALKALLADDVGMRRAWVGGQERARAFSRRSTQEVLTLAVLEATSN